MRVYFPSVCHLHLHLTCRAILPLHVLQTVYITRTWRKPNLFSELRLLMIILLNTNSLNQFAATKLGWTFVVFSLLFKNAVENLTAWVGKEGRGVKGPGGYDAVYRLYAQRSVRLWRRRQGRASIHYCYYNVYTLHDSIGWFVLTFVFHVTIRISIIVSIYHYYYT